MKIQPHAPALTPVRTDRTVPAAPPRAAERAEGSQDRVSRSAFAESLHGTEPAAIRPDKVARARALVGMGGLDAAVDLDKVVDALLAEL